MWCWLWRCSVGGCHCGGGHGADGGGHGADGGGEGVVIMVIVVLVVM